MVRRATSVKIGVLSISEFSRTWYSKAGERETGESDKWRGAGAWGVYVAVVTAQRPCTRTQRHRRVRGWCLGLHAPGRVFKTLRGAFQNDCWRSGLAATRWRINTLWCRWRRRHACRRLRCQAHRRQPRSCGSWQHASRQASWRGLITSPSAIVYDQIGAKHRPHLRRRQAMSFSEWCFCAPCSVVCGVAHRAWLQPWLQGPRGL